MLNKSELCIKNRCRKCMHCSLCACCTSENTQVGWECTDSNSTPLLRAPIFCLGTDLCPRPEPNVDCLYKYGNKLLLIEIKAQPIKNIDAEQILKKLKSVYSRMGALTLQAFVLQLSSKLNSEKSQHKLLLECNDLFKTVGLKIGKGNLLHSSKQDLKQIRTNFFVIKCKDFNEQYFSSLL